jgi:hypothetical protein
MALSLPVHPARCQHTVCDGHLSPMIFLTVFFSYTVVIVRFTTFCRALSRSWPWQKPTTHGHGISDVSSRLVRLPSRHPLNGSQHEQHVTTAHIALARGGRPCLRSGPVE